MIKKEGSGQDWQGRKKMQEKIRLDKHVNGSAKVGSEMSKRAFYLEHDTEKEVGKNKLSLSWKKTGEIA